MALNPGDSSLSQPQFLDQYIDQRIDHFIYSLEKNLGGLQENLEQAENARLGLLANRRNSFVAPYRERMKRALQGLDDGLDELRKNLLLVLFDLNERSDFKPVVEDASGPSHFAPELEFIGKRVGQAERQIREYFFSSAATVNLADLRHDNMLIALYEARKMTQLLKKEF